MRFYILALLCLSISTATVIQMANAHDHPPAVQAEQVSRDNSSSGRVVWAKVDIPAHTKLTRGQLQAGFGHAKFVPVDAPYSLKEVVGRTTAVAISTGQIIRKSQLEISQVRKD